MTDPQQLPQALDAERAILGSALVTHGAALDRLDGSLRSEDFTDPRHRILFATMATMHNAGDGIDIVTVGTDAERHELLEKVGGKGYITSLTDGVPASTNVEAYARRVREVALRRRVIMTAGALQQRAYAGQDDGETLVEAFEQAFSTLAGQAQPGGLRSAADLVAEWRAALATPVRAGAPTGLPRLDAYLGGLQGGRLIILAGRTSTGKTTLATQIAYTVAAAGLPVAYCSLEMAGLEQTERVLSAQSRVDGLRIARRTWTQFERQKVDEAADLFAALPFWLDDTSALTPTQLRTRVRQIRARHGLGLVVVDYLQLLQLPRDREQTREQQVSAVSRELKHLAGELDVPVLALAQLSRRVEQRPDKRPMLSDLRESGGLEQDADQVLLLHRREEGDADGAEKPHHPVVDIVIAKNRSGPTYDVPVRWFDNEYRFVEMRQEER